MTMSINAEVKNLITPLGYPCEFMNYDGTKDSYFVFNFTNESPSFFGDDAPLSERYEMQLHFFSPKSFNHLSLKQSVKSILFQNGWSYPQTYTRYEEDTKKNHVVFTTGKEMKIDG